VAQAFRLVRAALRVLAVPVALLVPAVLPARAALLVPVAQAFRLVPVALLARVAPAVEDQISEKQVPGKAIPLNG
jgi:hypothetical protein